MITMPSPCAALLTIDPLQSTLEKADTGRLTPITSKHILGALSYPNTSAVA